MTKMQIDSWIDTKLGAGRYSIVAKLGEGGMGAVYRAHDSNLDTQVVVKVPHQRLLSDLDLTARFAREIRSLVHLAHPHIVKISDVGEHEGVPYVVMQFLPGGSLESRRPRDSRGNLVAIRADQVCGWLSHTAEALDFIHTKGFVHRDVKPANILFDGHGNVYLSDFGIIKALSKTEDQERAAAQTNLTAYGMVLGTPAYMAPEVLMGQSFDGRADQYSLGVAVYELLTGRRPFNDATTPAAMLVQQTTTDPVAPHLLQKKVPPRVSQAVLRALDRDPAKRFPTCLAFAREVETGASQPVASPPRRTGAAENLANSGEGHMLAEIITARSSTPENQAEHDTPLTKRDGGTVAGFAAADVTAVSHLPSTNAAPAQDASPRTTPDLPQASIAPQAKPGASVNTSVSQEIDVVPRTRKLICPECHGELFLNQQHAGGKMQCPDCNTSLSVAADLGSLVAMNQAGVAGAGLAVSAAAIPPRRSAPAPQAAPLYAASVEAAPMPLVQSQPVSLSQPTPLPEQRSPMVLLVVLVVLLAAAVGTAVPLVIWVINNQQQVSSSDENGRKDDEDSGTGGKNSGDTKPVNPAPLDEPKKPEPKQPEPLKPEPVKPEPVKPEPVKPEPKKPEPVKPEPPKPEPPKSDPKKPRTYEPGPLNSLDDDPPSTSRKPIGPIINDLDDDPFKAPPVKPDPFKPEPPKTAPPVSPPSTEPVPAAAVPSLVASPDNLTTLIGHKDLINAVAVSSTGKYVLTAAWDNTLILWDTAESRIVRTLTGHTHWVTCLVLLKDDRTAISGSWDNTIRVWDITTGETLKTLTGHTSFLTGVAVSKDGKYLASSSYDRSVRLWDLATGEPIRTLTGHTDDVRCVRFSPDGKKLVSGSKDNTVRVWEVETGKELLKLTGHLESVWSADFSPDGKQIASGSLDDTVRIWDADTGKEVAALKNHTNNVLSLMFTADGRWLLTGSADKTMRVWSTSSWEELYSFTNGEGGFSGMCFTPGEGYIWTGGNDKVLRKWKIPESVKNKMG